MNTNLEWLILARHAQKEFLGEGLNEAGKTEAKGLARNLLATLESIPAFPQLTFVAASEAVRAVETAEILASCLGGLPVKKFSALGDVSGEVPLGEFDQLVAQQFGEIVLSNPSLLVVTHQLISGFLPALFLKAVKDEVAGLRSTATARIYKPDGMSVFVPNH